MGVFFTNLRIIFHVSTFSQEFRVMLQIIIRAFWDLKIFLFVLYLLIGIIAICKFIVETSDKDIF